MDSKPYGINRALKVHSQGTGKMVQWMKCLPCKHEDLHLIDRTYKSKTDMVVRALSPVLGRQSAHWPVSHFNQLLQSRKMSLLIHNAQC